MNHPQTAEHTPETIKDILFSLVKDLRGKDNETS